MNKKLIALFVAAILGFIALVPTTSLSTVNAQANCAILWDYYTPDGQTLLQADNPRLPLLKGSGTERYVIADPNTSQFYRYSGSNTYQSSTGNINNVYKAGLSGTLTVVGNVSGSIIAGVAWNGQFMMAMTIVDDYGQEYFIRASDTTCNIPTNMPTFATLGAAAQAAGGGTNTDVGDSDMMMTNGIAFGGG